VPPPPPRKKEEKKEIPHHPPSAQGLLKAFQAGDEGLYATHVAEFDSVIRLDAWKTKILLAGKRR
jgi:hypothetical protein